MNLEVRVTLCHWTGVECLLCAGRDFRKCVPQGCLRLFMCTSGFKPSGGEMGSYENGGSALLVVSPSTSMPSRPQPLQGRAGRRGMRLKLPVYWVRQQQKIGLEPLLFKIFFPDNHAVTVNLCHIRIFIPSPRPISTHSRMPHRHPDWAHLEINLLFTLQISCLLLYLNRCKNYTCPSSNSSHLTYHSPSFLFRVAYQQVDILSL